MAHEVETMAYAGELPWHGLGVPVSNDLTPAQMQQKAGLDWNVEKIDAFVNIGGQQVKTGQQALVRTSDNTILTNVGEGWNPVQNSEAFDFFTDFVMEGDMEMHTAGSLKNGQIKMRPYYRFFMNSITATTTFLMRQSNMSVKN